MQPPLHVGQQLAIIEAWTPKQLAAAMEDYFNVDDGTLDFNISNPMHPPRRQYFNFDDISNHAVLKNLINICPDVVECFNTYKPLMVHYALDANIDFNNFNFMIPLDKLKESLLYKFKTSAIRLEYFIEILEFMKVKLDACDDDIEYMISKSNLNFIGTITDNGCVKFERFLKITNKKSTFTKLLNLYTPFIRVASYIEKLQYDESLAVNYRIKDAIGIDCIEWLILFKLKEDGNVKFVTSQIKIPEYMRVINKFKLLHGHLTK